MGLVFGVTWQKKAGPVGLRFAEFATWLGKELGTPVTPRAALSYEELGRLVRDGEVDLAWLPPIVYIDLLADRAIDPLCVHWRATEASYQAVLLVREDGKIQSVEGLRGSRVAWVDPFSAAGYVLPRIKLAALGIDPRTSFSEQRFCGSHDAAVRALLAGKSDVAGTFATLGDDGRVARGAWSDVPEASTLRVLAAFGSIPADVTAARLQLEPAMKESVTRALARACDDGGEITTLVREVFGVDCFKAADDADVDYGPLRRAIDVARSLGVLPPGT